MTETRAVLLDLDGTLVDSNYFHVLSWARAFHRGGRSVPMSEIHRCIGMGGDQLMERLLGGEDEQIHAWTKEEFSRVRDEVRPTPGAADLVRALSKRGARTVYATSGSSEDTEVLCRTIGADDWVDEVVCGSDVEATKPAPDIFVAALERAGVAPDRAIVVGDTVWDIEAARRSGLSCVAVLVGGVCRAELEAAGAAAVYESPADLLEHLDESPVGRLLGR